jgi:hypothetical protein
MLLKFLRPVAPYLVGVAAVVGVVVYVAILRRELSSEKERNVSLVADNQADLAAIAAYKAQQQKWNAALATLDTQTLATNDSTGHIVDGITAAPATDDAPVAPVLATALDALRALQGNAP